MPGDPSRLYSHLPGVFDRHPESDQYKLLAGLAQGTEDARAAVADTRKDLVLATADGAGLERRGENFGTARPPGMSTTPFAVRRSTLALVMS